MPLLKSVLFDTRLMSEKVRPEKALAYKPTVKNPAVAPVFVACEATVVLLSMKTSCLPVELNPA